MGQKVSNNICCSTRDKNERGGLRAAYPQNSQFWYAEVELRLDDPRSLSLAPLWSNEVPVSKRLAVAGSHDVHIYSIREDQLQLDLPRLRLEHKWAVPETAGSVTGLLFTEETNSRSLAIAVSLGRKNCVRIWPLDPSPLREGVEAKVWNLHEGFLVSLDDHKFSVVRMVVSPQYLLSVDTSGVCSVWQKSRNFQRKATQTLHKGGVVDLVADRLFAYSAGMDDRSIAVWSLPDLTLIQTVGVEIPKAMLPDMPQSDATNASSSSSPSTFVRVTGLRRPLSRWAGAQGSSRQSSHPKGTLFISGLLTSEKAPAETERECAGVLMEWTLGAEPICQCAQLAHESPIASLMYGPEDNGPVITADAKGQFCVWDTVPRLNCSQQVRVVGNAFEDCPLAVAMEPQHGLYSTIGDRRLFIWRRRQRENIDEPM